MAERVVWGLDIGQTALRAVRLERGKGSSVTMTGAFFTQINSQPDDPQHEDKVREALDEFVAVCNPGKIPLVLSLPGFTTLFRSFPLPHVAAGKLREVVSYEARQLIPYPLEEVQWDFQQLQQNEDTGEMQIALMCCRKDIINNLLAMTDELDLVVEDIQISPIALINFFLYDSPPEGMAMLLDCGARSTDFAMFNDESFWLRSIAVCGDDFSRTLMKKFNISFEDAEQLKTNMADAKQAARVFKVVEPVMRNLAAEAQRSFGFYRSNNRGASVGEMILSGRTFLMEGADQYMADTLGYGARTLDMPQNIMVSPMVDTTELMGNRQVYGIACGLALQGIGLGRYNCSLLSDSRKMQKLIKGKQKFGWVAAALVVITVLLAAVTTKSQKPLFDTSLKDIRMVTQAAEKRKKEYQEKMDQFKPALERNRRLVKTSSGRGLLDNPLDLVMHQIEMLNFERFSQINPTPITNLPLENIIRNLRANIMANTASRGKYELMLKEKSALYKIDDQTDEDIKKKMQEQLQMQVLRRVAMMHNRQGRTFLTDQSYRVGKAVKATQGDEVTWKIEGAKKPVKANAPGGNMMPEKLDLSALEDEMNDEVLPGGTQDGAAPVDVVIVEISGFTVTENSADMIVLRDRLDILKNAGLFYSEFGDIPGFKLIRPESATTATNTINLPVIYDPSPVKADPDAAGEGGAVDRNEKLAYEPYSSEVVLKFKAVFVYEPLADEIPAQKLETLIDNAVSALSVSVDAKSEAPVAKPEGGDVKVKQETVKPAE